MKDRITKTFTITANQDMMKKIERVLCWLHLNTSWGHSATVAFDCDGDGSDYVRVDNSLESGVEGHYEYIKELGRHAPKEKRVEWIGLQPAPNE